MAGLLDPIFAGGLSIAQEDPQEAYLADLFRRMNAGAQRYEPPQMPQQAPPAQPQQQPSRVSVPRFEGPSTQQRIGDFFTALGGGAVPDREAQMQQAEQGNRTLDILREKGVDERTLLLARYNPEVMKTLVARAFAPANNEEFKEVEGQGYAISKGLDGRISARRLELGTPTGNAALPGTIEGAGRSYKSPKEVTEVAGKLRGDFEGAPAYKDHAATAAAYNKLDSAFKDPSPAGDIAATYAFMKMMDPGSVVRESEFMMLGKAGSLPEKIQQMFNRAATGEGLTPAMRADIQRQAKGVYEQSKRMFGRHQENYRGMAQRFYVDPANVVYDMAEPEIGTAQAPPAPSAPLDMTAVQGRGSQPFLDKTPMTPEQAANLPPGTPFYTTDGRLMVKN